MFYTNCNKNFSENAKTNKTHLPQSKFLMNQQHINFLYYFSSMSSIYLHLILARHGFHWIHKLHHALYDYSQRNISTIIDNYLPPSLTCIIPRILSYYPHSLMLISFTYPSHMLSNDALSPLLGPLSHSFVQIHLR